MKLSTLYTLRCASDARYAVKSSCKKVINFLTGFLVKNICVFLLELVLTTELRKK